MTYAIGIDLGTTFTAAAVFQSGGASPLPLGQSDTRLEIPTALHVRGKRSQWSVGMAALDAAMADPSSLITGFKRDIGRSQPVLVDGQSIAPAELMLAMLEHVLAVVDARQGTAPAHVTLTHPANWGLHRQAELRHIAEAAGLANAGLLPEPDATAIFHAATRPVPVGSLFAVYDLGGGTFDISLLAKSSDRFELIGPSQGIEELGGLDFDDRLWTIVTDRLGSQWFAANDGSDDALRRSLQLDQAVTQARERLSEAQSVDIAVELPGEVKHVSVSRSDFEADILGLVDRTVELLARTCASCNVSPADLSAVMLTGGTSRTPLIAQRLRDELGVDVISEPQPKYSVCLGAAVTAAAVADIAVDRTTLGPSPATSARSSTITVSVDIERSGLGGSHDLALQSVPLGAAVNPIRRRPIVEEVRPVSQSVTVITGEHQARSGLGIVIGLVVVVLVIVALLLAL